MNLSEFLLARIAEDELLARIAEDERAARAAADRIPLMYHPDVLRVDYIAQSQHIARWDPARVLAECASKRRIVELHAITVTEDWVNPTDGPAYRDDDHTCAICGWVRDACETVKLLALPYADHPDYDQSWRP